MDFITKLRQEFSTLKGEYENLLKETEKREYSADEKTSQDTRFARMEAIKGQLEERAKFAKLAVDAGNVTLPVEPEGKTEFDASKQVDIVVKDSKIDRMEFNAAALKWALTGEMDRKFASITTATQTGILLPTSVANPETPVYLNAFREAYAAYGMTPLFTADTGKLSIPIMSASAGGVVAETASSATENPPVFTDSVVLTPATYQSGTAWISGLAMGANGFDLVGYIETELEHAKEIGLEDAIVADLISDVGITQNRDVAGTDLAYEDLVAFNRALPRRFDRLKVMVVDGTLFNAMEGLTDNTGKPILVMDPQNQNLVRFNGTPVFRVDSFADYQSTETSCLGVIFSLLGFKLRDAGQKQLLRYQESAKPNQLGLNLVSYHAYGWADTAVAKLMY